MTIVGAIAVPHPPLVVPAVGCGEERRIESTIGAYQQAVSALLDLAPDTIIVSSIAPEDTRVQIERFEVVRHTRGGEARK